MRLDLFHILEGKKKKADDPTVILINGLFADLTSFDGASFYLREKFQFLRYDCRGQGKSPKPETVYHLRDHVEDLRGLLLELKLGPIVLVGLSNGGRVALEYARVYGDEVLGVVACDTYDEPTPMIKAKLGSWLNAFLVGGGLHRFDVATPWIWGEEVFNEKCELLLSYRELAAGIPAHVVNGLIGGALESRIELSEISAPVLLLAGREDLLTPPFLHEKMVLKLQKGKFEVTPGGHASLIEKPTIMDHFIIPWIENLI